MDRCRESQGWTIIYSCMQYIVLRLCLNVTGKIEEMITQGKRARADSLDIQVLIRNIVARTSCILYVLRGVFMFAGAIWPFSGVPFFLYVFFAFGKKN